MGVTAIQLQINGDLITLVSAYIAILQGKIVESDLYLQIETCNSVILTGDLNS
jgi:hypothetical protein